MCLCVVFFFGLKIMLQFFFQGKKNHVKAIINSQLDFNIIIYIELDITYAVTSCLKKLHTDLGKHFGRVLKLNMYRLCGSSCSVLYSLNYFQS